CRRVDQPRRPGHSPADSPDHLLPGRRRPLVRPSALRRDRHGVLGPSRDVRRQRRVLGRRGHGDPAWRGLLHAHRVAGRGRNVSSVLAVARARHTIAFATLPDRTFGDLPFAVSAAASSGLPVSLTASGNCTIAAGVLTLGGGGSCTATASQAGNADYEPAADV